MKFARSLVPLAALGNAFVILQEDGTLTELEKFPDGGERPPATQSGYMRISWLRAIAEKTSGTMEYIEDVLSGTTEVPDLSEVPMGDLQNAASYMLYRANSEIFSQSIDLFDNPPPHHPPPHHPPPHHPPPHHPPTSDKTIYELLQLSNHTKKFLSLVSEHESLVDVLNSTKANHTLFVPTDEAFEKIPSHEKPSKEFLEAFLKYHVVDGHLTSHDIWKTHTLPTLLEESFLGGEKQRLRVRFTLRGVTINAHSHIVAHDIFASNGVVHGIDYVLVPPFMLGKELSLLPTYFSTFLYAYEKTDFVSYIHGVHMVGTTLFAPTNHAWAKLGHRANAFLFETERGREFLKALLKYQIVANVTFYSDAIYDKTGEDNHETGGYTTWHTLKTLLGKDLLVRVWRWGGWTEIKVNENAVVVFEDGIAKNGVIQVVNSVLLPPCKHGQQDKDSETEISVDDLVERLGGWMEEQENTKPEGIIEPEGQPVFGDL